MPELLQRLRLLFGQKQFLLLVSLAAVGLICALIGTIILIKHLTITPALTVQNATEEGQNNIAPAAPPTEALVSSEIESIVVQSSTKGSVYTFTATIKSTVKIDKVIFYANTKEIGTITSTPYQVTVQAGSLPEGRVAIAARAYDINSKVKTSESINLTITAQQRAAAPAPPASISPIPQVPEPSTPPSTPPPSPSTPYVQPGTQGYRGSMASLTVYSAENGQLPPSQGCTWDQDGVMDCRGDTLTLDHAYVKGGIYWTGCGNLVITNSIIEWAPSAVWHNVQAACDNGEPGATLKANSSTFRTNSMGVVYTGGSDVGSINTNSSRPMIVSNSLFKDFPQGLNPPGGSVIKNNEIYTSDVWCPRDNEVCHSDGLYSQGGNNITYEGNYIVSQIDPIEATAAIFFQSGTRSNGHKIIGNYIKGGAYTFYNQSADNITVENNTFGGYKFGDVSNTGTIASWINNKRENGAVVPQPN